MAICTLIKVAQGIITVVYKDSEDLMLINIIVMTIVLFTILFMRIDQVTMIKHDSISEI